VIVADTNIWARAYLRDDADQTPQARKLLDEAQASDGVFVPLVLLAELAWVLRAKWRRESILATFEELLSAHGVTVEAPLIAQAAIDAAREGNGGFTDHLIAQIGLANGATETATFDESFGNAAKVRWLRQKTVSSI
jgi:predicted nucleic-acid-binding protein